MDGINRSSRLEVFCKKGVLRNLAKFTGKYLRPATLLKKRLWHRCLFNKTPFLQNTYGGCFISSTAEYFVYGCSRKHIFISNLTHTPWNLHFWSILIFQNFHSIFKVIFRASELPQRPKSDTFQETSFWTSTSRKKLVLKFVTTEAGQHLCSIYSFL